VMTVHSVAFSRLMNSCDPHLAQKSFSRFCEDL
jgi:hypothetical protein